MSYPEAASKPTSAVSMTLAVRSGAVCQDQYLLVWAITFSGWVGVYRDTSGKNEVDWDEIAATRPVACECFAGVTGAFLEGCLRVEEDALWASTPTTCCRGSSTRPVP